MVITKTPFRISLAGGGTDLPSYYKIKYGSVINFSIDKYIYVVVKKQLGVVEYKYRINWSTVEFCNSIDKIKHPIVRKTLQYFKINFPIQISTFSDVPAYTGLGSSSSFSVGLINAISKLLKKNYSKKKIASIAFLIENSIKNRIVGKQDHYCASFGGLNRFDFHKNETVKVKNFFLNDYNKKKLENLLLLFYTKKKRKSESILNEQSKKTKSKLFFLDKMKIQVDQLEQLLKSKNYNEIGKLLKEGWELKKNINKSISNKSIDSFYNYSISKGALGGKILGAGNGGFMLIFIKKLSKRNFLSNFDKKFELINFAIDTEGTKLIYMDKGL